MTIVERTTPTGLFHYAHSYAASAIQLNDLSVDATHADAPVRYLFCHAIELYFKSYLLLRGVALDSLRSRQLGHDLVALQKAAAKHGLRLNEEVCQQIVVANEAIFDRYIVTGVRRILSPDAFKAICAHLNTEAGRAIYVDAGFNRKPPNL